MVNEEIGEAHEVLPPAEQDGEYCGNEQGPFELAFHSQGSKYKKEHNDGTYIYGTTCSGLVAPIGIALGNVGPETTIGFFQSCILVADVG